MKADAALFYGTSRYAQPAPVVENPQAVSDVELARTCLEHMSRRAGGFKYSMSLGVKVARHPAGQVYIYGNGWSVQWVTEEFVAAAAEAGKGGGNALVEFIKLGSETGIPSDKLMFAA